MIARIAFAALLALFSLSARAQFDYSAYGTLDLSYGRFQPSGFLKDDRFNSNSLSASFVGANASYGFDGGWKPGITVETFLRFQDRDYGRNDDDPFLSRNAFASLDSDYGRLRLGRMQTDLFVQTTRFNAFGNSIAFGPAFKQIFGSGGLESVQGDFYWDRVASYTSPKFDDIPLQANVMYALGRGKSRGNYVGSSLVFSRGVFAASLVAQRVRFDNGIDDRTDETTWQAGATYNFGWARVFGLFTHTRDDGLESSSRLGSAGVSVPVWEGSVLAQVAYGTASGPAVDRRHTTTSLGYVYNYDSTIDVYLLGQDDRVRNQARGTSVAVGVRYQF